MTEKKNMFETRMNEDRRKQFIEENLDIADHVLAASPNINILQNENAIKEQPEEIQKEIASVVEKVVESIEPLEITKEQSIEPEYKSTPFKLSLLKREKTKKKTFNYYLEDSIDKMTDILSKAMNISKSEIISLLLKSAILSNEDIQGLAEENAEVKKLLVKLKN